MASKKNNTTNLSNFEPKGKLGALFAQARMFNQLNDQLFERLPKDLKKLSLCALKDNTATFVTHDQALAFRAQKQHDLLLDILKDFEALSDTQKVIIKIDLKQY